MSQRYDFLPILNFWGNFWGCGILVVKLASVFCNPLVQLPVHQAGPLLSIVTVSARRHSNSCSIHPNLVSYSDPTLSRGNFLHYVSINSWASQWAELHNASPNTFGLAQPRKSSKITRGLWQRPTLASHAFFHLLITRRSYTDTPHTSYRQTAFKGLAERVRIIMITRGLAWSSKLRFLIISDDFWSFLIILMIWSFLIIFVIIVMILDLLINFPNRVWARD